MKVLLINPPLDRLIGEKNAPFPLGLGYLASALLSQGNEDVKILDLEYCDDKDLESFHMAYSKRLENYNNYISSLENPNHPAWNDLENVLDKYRPDVIGISIMTVRVAPAFKVASICKDKIPDSIIIVGGPHPTVLPEEVLQNEDIGFVVRGEGEKTIAELVSYLSKNNDNFLKIDGISFRNNGEIVHTKGRKLIEDLDNIPFPARDLIIGLENYPKGNMGYLITSRGCPFRCAYCGSHTIWGRKVRFRSAKNIVDEIREVHDKYGTDYFIFWDDIFTFNRKRVIEICNLIMENNIKIRWRCITRADMIDEELISIMKKAGCDLFDIGVESGSERILKSINKKISLERVKGVSKSFKKLNMNWAAFFMIGLPNETKEDMFKSLEFMKQIKPQKGIVSIFTPLPGTELFDEVVQLGLINRDADWTKFSQWSPNNHFVKNFSKEEFQKISKEIISQFDEYNNRRGNWSIKSRLGRLIKYFSLR